MKILLAVCCSNPDGNTDRLADAFLSGAAEAGHQVKKVFLGDDIHGCRGCGACQVSGKGCVIHDVMDQVYPLYDWCDTVVLASPLFFWTVSAQTKAFLDRLYAVGKEDHYPKRNMALLMTAESDEEFTFQNANSFFEFISRIHGGRNLGTCFAGGCKGKPGHHSISEENLQKAYRFGLEMKP